MTATTSILYNRLSAWLENQKAKMTTQYLILASATVLAAMLRFFRVEQWSFWRDEIAQINRALGHFNIETIISQWWRPPLSVLLSGLSLNLLGINEFAARLPSVLIGVISIPVIYFIVRHLLSDRIALIVALLFTVSPWHIYWSQNARFYTSLMVLYFLASIAFFLFIERGQARYFLLFGILFFFALSERMIAILLVPVLVAYLAILWISHLEKPPGFTAKRLALLLLGGLVFCILELYSYLTTSTTRLAFTYETFIGRTIDDPFRILILIFFNIGIPLVVMALFGTLYSFNNKSRTTLFLSINAIIPVVILAVTSMFSFVVDRYAFVTLPAWIILAAYFLVEVGRRYKHSLFVTAGLILVLLIDAIGVNLIYYQINHGNRPEWKRAFEFITTQSRDGDIIVSSVAELGHYYVDQDVVWLGDLNTKPISSEGKRYWFVLDSENSWFSPEQKKWVERNADLLEIYYLRVREEINLKIYLYTPGYENPTW
jgi:mannosyltransferase